jgi:hypothetical protein
LRSSNGVFTPLQTFLVGGENFRAIVGEDLLISQRLYITVGIPHTFTEQTTLRGVILVATVPSFLPTKHTKVVHDFLWGVLRRVKGICQ